MKDDEAITEKQMAQAQAKRLNVIPLVRARRTTGYHFVDQLSREAKAAAGINSLTATSYTVRTTIRPDLQRAAEAALQEGLAQYELGAGRARFDGAEANRRRDQTVASGCGLSPDKRAWQTALGRPLAPDVHWIGQWWSKTRARNRRWKFASVAHRRTCRYQSAACCCRSIWLMSVRPLSMPKASKQPERSFALAPPCRAPQ
jgi:hypothetical protein